MWYCQTKEAQKQIKTCKENQCKGCEKCVWIEESKYAMIANGTPIVNKHPLYEMIKDKFNGQEIK